MSIRNRTWKTAKGEAKAEADADFEE